MVAKSPPLFTTRNASRLMIGLVGMSILVAAMVTPWWTRGMTIDYNDDNPRGVFESGIEGMYFHYGPFSTPGSIAGVSSDGMREVATAVLGVAMLVVIGCVAAYQALRFLHSTGRIELSPNVPVRLAMTATLIGAFAVIWAALFLPLMGPNPGYMWGTEAEGGDGFFGESQAIESTRFGNVGFYMGILGAVVYPIFLWVAATNARTIAETTTTGKTTKGSTA